MTEQRNGRALRPVANLLRARSVAIVGASPKGQWPAILFKNLTMGGFPGKVYPVNPNYPELWGVPCYPNLKSLPEPAEHLAMLVPTPAVLPTLEEAVPLGTKAATIYSAGFGEGDDPKGKERGKALSEFCDRTGLVCCGPNCMGTTSVREGHWTYAMTLPLLRPGPVGLIFQSGGSLGNWMKGSCERGICFSYAISSGNETNLDLVDYLSFLVEDVETKLIVLFVEGIRRPDDFMELAARALRVNKPILIGKIGRSQAGKRQAISHTGALAGSDEVFNAVCHRLGLVRCASLEDLLETTLAFLPGRIPQGKRSAIVVNSGGMKGILLDHIEEVDFKLAELSAATKDAVRPLITGDLVVENPLECGVAGFGNDQGFRDIVRNYAVDNGVDLLAIHGELPRAQEKRDPANFKALADITEKPILAFARSTYSLTEESRTFQEKAGMPFLQGIRGTLRAMQGLGSYAQRRNDGIPALSPATGRAEDLQGDSLAQLLEAQGLTLPHQALVATPAEASAQAEKIGFPVVLKLLAPEIIHKTESGAVALGLRSAKEVRNHGERLLAGSKNPAQLLVQETVAGTEVILGTRTDPQFGPFIMVGLGGIFVEVLKDTSLRLLPVDEKEASAMLKELKGYPVLEGVRGQGRRDISALVRAIVGLSEIFANHRSHLSDLEVNPFIVREQGSGVAAVDVRVIRK